LYGERGAAAGPRGCEAGRIEGIILVVQRTLIDDRYTLVEPLGGGGMAKVYLAHDEVLGRDVALKILRDMYAEDEEFVERFRREARSAASLSHPNIVQVYDQGRSEDGAYYIAMEYVAGGTLKDRILRDGAIEPGAATGVGSQIADALQAAHEKGVIHRDIKPQNVLVTGTGDVKVTDFGIARAASSPLTATSAVLGTAGYMSPEQAMGEPVGPQSDLYSLGVVLYEMLTGDLPYRAESPISQAMMHVNEPPRSPREANPEVSEPLDALTLKLLSKNPEDRHVSAGALANDLDRIRAGFPPVSTATGETGRMTAPPPPGGRTRKTVTQPPATAPGRDRRRRGRLLPLLAALLFGVILLGALGWASDFFEGFDLTGSGSSDSGEKQTATNGVEVPDLAYFWEADARLALSNAGLSLGTVRREASDTVLGRQVVRTDPGAGEEVDRGSVVDLVVSTGPQWQQGPVQNAPQVPAQEKQQERLQEQQQEQQEQLQEQQEKD
jgi:eukaryotic-like serine/threonine-protein kinase